MVLKFFLHKLEKNKLIFVLQSRYEVTSCLLKKKFYQSQLIHGTKKNKTSTLGVVLRIIIIKHFLSIKYKILFLLKSPIFVLIAKIKPFFAIIKFKFILL